MTEVKKNKKVRDLRLSVKVRILIEKNPSTFQASRNTAGGGGGNVARMSQFSLAAVVAMEKEQSFWKMRKK